MVGALEQQRTLAGAIRDADRDKVGGGRAVDVRGEPDGPPTRIHGRGGHHGLPAGGFETRPYDQLASAGNLLMAYELLSKGRTQCRRTHKRAFLRPYDFCSQSFVYESVKKL